MTKKKGEFGIDDDFNFDDFNFNDNIPGMDPAKDNRKPITKVAGAFLDGMKDTAGSEPFIRRLVSDSLPPGYGKAINTTYEGLGTLRELYDSGVREFQPADTALRSITGKLVPTMRKVLPKGLADKLEGYSKGGPNGYKAPSQGQVDEQTISQSLGDIFKTQAAADYKKGLYDEAKQDIRDSIDDKKFKLGFKTQQTTSQSLQRLVAYQDNVTSNYQKKNLELQYRQYFALRDISQVTRVESRISNEFLKAIAKNSALPDIVKSKKMEVMKQMFEERLFSGAANHVGKFMGGFMPELKKRIIMNGRNAIQGFARGVTDANDMAGMAGSMNMGVGELGGNVAGGMGADELSYQAAKKLREKLGNVEFVKRYGNILDDKFSGIPEKLNTWGRTASTRTGILGWLENLGKSMVHTYSEDTRVGESPIQKLDKATQFNNHTQRSITEIIPGYLARIWREISWSRTGSDPGLRIYNLDRGTFTTDHQAGEDVKARVLHPTQVQSFRQASDRMIDTIDPHKEMTPEQRKALQRQHVLDASSGKWIDHEQYMKPGYHINGASGKDNDAIVAFLRRKYGVKEGEHKIDVKNQANADAKRSSREAWEDMRRRFPTPTDMLRVYMESGYGDVLRQQEMVTKNGLNDVVDSDWLYRYMTGDDGLNGGTPTGGPTGGGGGGGNHGGGGGYFGGGSGGGKTVYSRMEKGPRFTVAGPLIGKNAKRKKGKGKRDAKTGHYTGAPKGYHRSSIHSPIGPEIEIVEDSKLDALLEKNAAAMDAVKKAMADVVNSAMGHGAPGKKGPAEHPAAAAARQQSEEHYKSHTDTLGESITKTMDANTAKLVETLEAGKISKENEIQGHALEAIEKLVRYIAHRVSGKTGSGKEIGELGDADFNFEDDDTLGDSPEARLVRRLKKWRKGAKEGFRRGKEGAGRAFDWAKKKAKGYWSSGTGILGTAGKWTKDTLKEYGDRFLDAAGDLYIKGRNSPVLEKAKLIAGEYYDASGKVIRRWSDITGSVYDKAGNIVVDAKDISRGFYDLHGKRVVSSVSRKVAGLVAKAAMMFTPIAWLKMGKDMLTNVGNRLRDMVDSPVDIYVKGEQHPRMKGIIMAAGGYFSDRTKKAVMRPSQIDGIIRDDKGDIVIDLPDLQKGLVNVFGFPVGSLSQVAKRLVVGAFKHIKDRVKKVVDVGKKAVAGAWNIAKNTFHGAVNIAKHGVGHLFGASSEEVKKQTNILQQIYDLLDERLPGKKLRLGSFQDELGKEHPFESNAAKADATFKKSGAGGMFAGLAAWLKSKFGGKKKDDDDDGDSNSYNVDMGGAAEKEEGKVAKKGAGKLAQWIEKKIPGGKWITKGGRFLGKAGKGIWNGAKALDPTGILSGLGWAGGKLKGLGGKALRGLKGSRLGGKIGNLAKNGWRGIKNLVKGPGKGLAEVGGEGLGEAGMAEAGAAGLGEAAAGTGLATTGTALAGGAEAASVAGLGAEGVAAGVGGAEVLGAVAAGAGALLTAPVLLGAAAIAALAYGGYKLYRHFKDKISPLEAYRMAQYGVDKDSPDKYNKIRQLEQLLEPHVSITGSKAKIQPKSVSLSEMLNIFDIVETDKDKVMRFGTWFVKRFEPVFLTHETILQTMCDKCKIADVDSMKKELKMKYLDNTIVPETVYSVGTSPFTKWSWFHHVADPIHTSSKFVEQAAAEARNALMAEGVKKESSKAMAAIKPVMGNDKGPGSEEAKKDKVAHTVALWGGNATTRPGAKGPGSQSISTIEALELSKDPSGLTALQAVRMRTYGLIKLDMDKVRNILDLEDYVLAHQIETKAGAGATFNGDPAKTLGVFGARFGCHDDATKAAWANWFTSRFLGTLIQYVTSVQMASASAARMLTSGGMNPEGSLKPAQLLKIANDIVGAKGKVKGTMVSVWNIEDSPWPNYQMNDDSSLTSPNINALKDLVKEEESKAPTSDGKAKGKAGAKPSGTMKTPASATAKSKGGSTSAGKMALNFGGGGGPSVRTSVTHTSMMFSGGGGGGGGAAAGSPAVKPGATSGGAAAVAATWTGGRDNYAAKKGPGTPGFTPASSVPPPPVNRNAAIAQLRDVMQKEGITDPTAQANILANIQAESNFRPRDESLKYSASRLCQIFPTHFKSLAEAQACVSQGPEAVANAIYGGRMGNAPNEGYLYRGRGYIQLTGKSEYEQMSKLIGVDLVKNPDAANDPEVAAKIAVAYIKSRVKGGKLDDVNAVTAAVAPANLSVQQSRRAAMAKNFLKPGTGGFTPNTGASPGTAVADTAGSGSFKPNTGASPGAAPAGAGSGGFTPNTSAAPVRGPAPQGSGGFTPNTGASPGGDVEIASTPSTPPPTLTAPMPMVPVSGRDDAKVQRLNQDQVYQQTMADVSSKRNQDKSSGDTSQMVDLMSKQLEAQTSMDASLKSVDSKLSNLLTLTGKQLDALGKVGNGAGNGSTATAATSSQNKPLQKTPDLPVSVSRPTPAQLAG